MNVYTITLENTVTGEIAPSLICRLDTEKQAHEYAAAAIAKANRREIRVHSIASRPA